MTAALLIYLLILTVVASWCDFEAKWDRKLFTRPPDRVIRNLSAREAAALLSETLDAQVLDVRSPREFAGGSLPKAVNIPLSDPAFRSRLSALDRHKPLLVYCAGGYRSRKAVAILRELDFRSIHHLHRGILAWRWHSLPVFPTSLSST